MPLHYNVSIPQALNPNSYNIKDIATLKHRAVYNDQNFQSKPAAKTIMSVYPNDEQNITR